jgi:aminoglycoside phosphotransferase (APT) family kinase protein
MKSTMIGITEEQLVAPVALDVAYQTLTERLPQDDIVDVHYLPGGGSFSVFSLNNEKVARFPKFVTGQEEASIVEEQFHFEQRVLNAIHPFLAPHQISQPLSMLTGPSESFLGPVLLYAWLEGVPINRLAIAANQRLQLSSLLGDFFSRLHSIDRTLLSSFGFVDVLPERLKQDWFSGFERHRRTTFQLLTEEERRWYTRLFEDFLMDVEYMQPHISFCHGDCTPGNVLLVSEHTHLQVIDWDDMTIGDTARDLCRWLGSFGEDFLHAILEHYTIPVDACFIKRVKFYYCRTPLLYFSMAQQFESTPFLDFARQELHIIREKSKQQGWFNWS